VFIPLFPYQIAIFSNPSVQDVEFPAGKAVILCKRDGINPEFAAFVFSADMDMNRLIAIETEKKEPVTIRQFPYRRHKVVIVFKILSRTCLFKVTFFSIVGKSILSEKCGM